MNINDIHNTILFILDKEQDGFITHGEIDDMLDRAQLVLFNQYFNNPKVPASAQPQSYTQNQRVHDSLSPFKQLFTFTTANTPSGVLTLPNDFMNLLSLYTTVYNNTLGRNVYSAVQILPEDELIIRLESQVIPVGADEPIGIMNKENKIQLFPEQPSNGGVYYLRRPVKPLFYYTQTGREISYESANSVQLQWKQDDLMNIIMIALQYIGINLDADTVLQYANAKDKEGQ